MINCKVIGYVYMKNILLVMQITIYVLLLIFSMGNQKCLSAAIVDPLDGSGQSILLIDGTGDLNTTVALNILDYGVPGDVDYRINFGNWISIPGSDDTAQLLMDDGDKLDFRLNDSLFSFNRSDATILYTGGIDSFYAQNPTPDRPFYRAAIINWTGLDDSFKLEVLVTLDVHDGFHGGFAPIPVPKIVLLLGSGLLILIGVRKLGNMASAANGYRKSAFFQEAKHIIFHSQLKLYKK